MQLNLGAFSDEVIEFRTATKTESSIKTLSYNMVFCCVRSCSSRSSRMSLEGLEEELWVQERCFVAQDP